MDIVIVHDHEIYRNTLARVLSTIFPNFRISQFETGERFLEVVGHGHQFVLVMMDIRLPEMNGVDTTRLALEMDPGLSILGISINNDSDKINELKQAGAKGFLLKGGDKEGIKEAIESVLNNEMCFTAFD